MAESKKIAFFVPRLSVGGAQRVTLTITSGLAERGYEVDLVLAYPGGGLRDEVETSVNVVQLDVPRVPGIGLAGGIPKIRSYVRRARPAVFIATMTFANVVSLLSTVGDAEGTAIIAAEHDTFGMSDGAKVRLTRVLARYLYARADHVIAVSEGAAESVATGTRAPPENVSVLHNPIDVAAVREGAERPVDHPWLNDDGLSVVLGVGRMTPQKDFPTLVRAFDRLQADNDDVRLIIAGQGEGLAELRELVSRLGLSETVDLPGYVDDVYAYIGHADVFALSSAWEGLPTVLIEALACGTPVVATDCPSGPREILRDGKLGPLVPVGNPTALADALAETLASRPDPAQLRGRADEFAPAAVIDDYAAFVDRWV